MSITCFTITDKAGSSSMETVETSAAQASGKKTQSLAQQFYDDIYFDSDSDSENEGDAAKKAKKGKLLPLFLLVREI